jgi:predicted Zn-dependent peptidase
MSEARPVRSIRTTPRDESVSMTVLPNGLRVVTEAMPQLATAALGVWVGAGSRHEQPQEHGLAHLLEHMAFKGTARRSALAIAEEIEAVGGELNAETSIERTAYFARVLGTDVPLALDILADILCHPAFDEDELKREKGVVLQEIGACEDTPDELVFDMLMETAYRGASIGRRILGTPETVRAQDRRSMRTFLQSRYRTRDIVVAAAGAVSHDEVVAEATRLFDGFEPGPADPPHGAVYSGGEERVVRRLEQAHLVLGFEGLSFHEPDHYALHVFANMVGGGMSSRLFQEIREKRGLCYDVSADFWPFSDTGLFSVYGGTGEKQLGEFMPVLIDCLQQAAEAPTQAEVSRAKAQMKVGLMTALESPVRRAEQIARHTLAYGHVIGRRELSALIDAITPEDVARVGRMVLSRPPTLAAVGPVRRLMGTSEIASRLGAADPAPLGRKA